MQFIDFPTAITRLRDALPVTAESPIWLALVRGEILPPGVMIAAAYLPDATAEELQAAAVAVQAWATAKVALYEAQVAMQMAEPYSARIIRDLEGRGIRTENAAFTAVCEAERQRARFQVRLRAQGRVAA